MDSYTWLPNIVNLQQMTWLYCYTAPSKIKMKENQNAAQMVQFIKYYYFSLF